MRSSEILWKLINEISALLDGISNQVLKKVVTEIVQPVSSDYTPSFLLCDASIPNNFLAALSGPLLLFISLALPEMPFPLPLVI